MTKSKSRQRPPARRPASQPQKKATAFSLPRRLLWPGIVALVALGAFLIAKQQAQGPDKAVTPPATGLPDTPDYHRSEERRVGKECRL